MRGKFQILFLVCIYLLNSLSAQDIDIETQFGSDSILIGEQVYFSIILNSEGALQSVVPLDDQLFPGNIEVISQKSDSSLNEGIHRYRNDYLVTSFDSGTYKTNSIPVLVNRYQELDTLMTEMASLVVYTPEVDTSAAIRDIKAPAKTPFKLEELLPYAPYGGGLAILILAAVFLYLYLRKKNKQVLNLKPQLPPHIRALDELEKIKQEKLWQKGRVKEYYSQLSDVIRTYIEERYQIPAMESVTSEILQAFKKYSWEDENLMEILDSLLQLSDLVKFAKEDPMPSENELNLNNAFIFIEKTKPVEKAEKELTDQE